MKIATVIVTFNRLELLKISLEAHFKQKRSSDIIIVVDNASTDNTKLYLEEYESEKFIVINLNSNTGGAGGFYYGMKYLQDSGFDGWIWLMDDDAIPDPLALEKIISESDNTNNIYGSLPKHNNLCAWPNMTVNSKLLEKIEDFELEKEEVQWIPFLGFFINMSLIKKIGLPDKDFFLAADDVEYSLRAKRLNSKIYIVKGSLLEHPCADIYNINLGYRYFSNLKLSPWKRYYDTRNRLFVAKKFYGNKFYFQTIPGSFLRFFMTFIFENNKMNQTKAFFAGLYDGILGKSGKRHDYWRL